MPSLLSAIERVPVGSLEFFPGNARRGDVEAIARSLAENEQYAPIVVQRATRHVLAGNHTLKAAQSLGWPEIDVVFVDVDDQRARKINLSSNRTAELGGYDDDALVELLSYLDGDYDGTGWSEEDVSALIEPPAPPPPSDKDPDATPEPPAIPVTQPGDIWILGPHRIVCGDCRDFGTVERLLAGERVNVAFTSPPYASQRAYDESSGFKPIPPGEYADWFEDVQANVRAHLAEDGSWFVNIKEHAHEGQRDLYVKDLTIAHVRRWGWMFVDELCWVDSRNGFPGTWPNRFKDAWEPVFHFTASAGIKFSPYAVAHQSDGVRQYESGHHWEMRDSGYAVEAAQPETTQGLALPSNVMHLAAGGDGTHSAAFPVDLPAWFIRAYSDPGDTVFDPFMGSGSTLIAAHQENRTAYGCEISAGYCDVIAARWEAFTQIKPERVLPDGTTEPVTFT